MQNFLVITFHSMGVQNVEELEAENLEGAQSYSAQNLQQKGVVMVAIGSVHPRTGFVQLESYSNEVWSLRPDWTCDMNALTPFFSELMWDTFRDIRSMNE